MAILGATAAPSLATAQHAPAPATGGFDIGPPPVAVPSSCLFGSGDDISLTFLSGNAVFHDSSNKNGDWGGETAEGTAQLLVNGTPTYQGHLTIWGGGGNNTTLQTENGFTLNFSGTGLSDPSQTVALHANTQSTTNAAGTSTANVFNVQLACS
jgi:hypothetical protein